ncbi:hypothetical protein [Hyphobacterium sp.]|uniref:hypothetical protein n=1 Tax=Hyphobacterium sp. TaxID=2004662 RepID=UPI003B5243FB
MTIETYSNRHAANTAEQQISLESERIAVVEDGVLKRAIRLADVREVRLFIGMAGRDSQIICRISGHDGTRIAFGSRRWKSVGEWDNHADVFRVFNAALHARLEERADSVAFIEGQPFWSGILLPAIGLGLAALGAAFAVYFLRDGNPLALAGLPGMAIGFYLAWILRPRSPKPYDPATYAKSG